MLPYFIVIFFAALLAASIAMRWLSNKPQAETKLRNLQPDQLALLFDGDILHHASDPAMSLFALEPGTHYWGDLRACLLPRFPDFPEQPTNGERGNLTLRATDVHGPVKALIKWRGNLCWVTLFPYEFSEMDGEILDELAALRRVGETTPHPIWQEDALGHVIWYNKAYATLLSNNSDNPKDPTKPLFPHTGREGSQRLSFCAEPGGPLDWYELETRHVGEVSIHHTTCINAIVRAEDAQRNFVQTLTKTFAHLSIGLAIFDRKGQLALFNPALLDLTGLSAEFLSAKPTMLSFFDQLRENRQMPEPKNYLSWRQEIADVIAAATDGRYQEIWSLESGQTYNVKGRPHPDGATAFLIEDISAEMDVTRNFRAELKQAHSLLDALDDILAVFSPTGILTLSNAAYRSFWQVDPDSTFADITIRDCINNWKEQCTNNPDWHQIEEVVGGYGEREPCEMTFSLRDGTEYLCNVTPLPAGTTLVQFTQIPATTEVKQDQLQSEDG